MIGLQADSGLREPLRMTLSSKNSDPELTARSSDVSDLYSEAAACGLAMISAYESKDAERVLTLARRCIGKSFEAIRGFAFEYSGAFGCTDAEKAAFGGVLVGCMIRVLKSDALKLLNGAPVRNWLAPEVMWPVRNNAVVQKALRDLGGVSAGMDEARDITVIGRLPVIIKDKLVDCCPSLEYDNVISYVRSRFNLALFDFMHELFVDSKRSITADSRAEKPALPQAVAATIIQELAALKVALLINDSASGDPANELTRIRNAIQKHARSFRLREKKAIASSFNDVLAFADLELQREVEPGHQVRGVMGVRPGNRPEIGSFQIASSGGSIGGPFKAALVHRHGFFRKKST